MSAPSRGLGKAVLGVIGLRLALVPLFFGVNRVLVSTRPGFHVIRNVVAGERILALLSTMLVAVLFMIWVRSEIVALRQVGIQTKTTPLMAILGWFIPFANFVLPLLGVREVYKYRLPRSSGALPIAWWIAYLASMVTNNVPHLPFPIGMLVTLAAFGTWFAVVWSVVMAPREASFASPGPLPFPPQQQYYAPPRM